MTSSLRCLTTAMAVVCLLLLVTPSGSSARHSSNRRPEIATSTQTAHSLQQSTRGQEIAEAERLVANSKSLGSPLIEEIGMEEHLSHELQAIGDAEIQLEGEEEKRARERAEMRAQRKQERQQQHQELVAARRKEESEWKAAQAKQERQLEEDQKHGKVEIVQKVWGAKEEDTTLTGLRAQRIALRTQVRKLTEELEDKKEQCDDQEQKSREASQKEPKVWRRRPGEKHVCLWTFGKPGRGGMANTFGYTNAALTLAMENGFRYFWPELSPPGHVDSSGQDMIDIFGGVSDPFLPANTGSTQDENGMPVCVEAKRIAGCATTRPNHCEIEHFEVTLPRAPPTAVVAAAASSDTSVDLAVLSAILPAGESLTQLDLGHYQEPNWTDLFHGHVYNGESDTERDRVVIPFRAVRIIDQLNEAGLNCAPYIYDSYNGPSEYSFDDNTNDGNGNGNGNGGDSSIDFEDFDQNSCCAVIGINYHWFYPHLRFENTREYVRDRYRRHLPRSGALSRLYNALFLHGGGTDRDQGAITINDDNDESAITASKASNMFENVFLVVVHFRMGDVVNRTALTEKRMNILFPMMCVDALAHAMGLVPGAGSANDGGDGAGADVEDGGDQQEETDDGGSDDARIPGVQPSLPVRAVLLAEAPSDNAEVQELLARMRTIDPNALHFGDDLTAALAFHAMAVADILIASESGFPRLAAVVKSDNKLTIAPPSSKSAKFKVREHGLDFANVVVPASAGTGCAKRMFFALLPLDPTLKECEAEVNLKGVAKGLAQQVIKTGREAFPKSVWSWPDA